ncbi:uncharacterized protein LOC135498099 [Lineus longissimus]|uniref:uncharacterized protein LOC135498099 n=1 Tax=Lineus longissimus TaxID=88925 RepID=UPI00315DC708
MSRPQAQNKKEETEFWLSIPRFYSQAHMQTQSFDVNVLEFYLCRCKEYLKTLNVMALRAHELGTDDDYGSASASEAGPVHQVGLLVLGLHHGDQNDGADGLLTQVDNDMSVLVLYFLKLREDLTARLELLQRPQQAAFPPSTIDQPMQQNWTAERLNRPNTINSKEAHLHQQDPEPDEAVPMTSRHAVGTGSLPPAAAGGGEPGEALSISVGRPRVDINAESVRRMREVGYNWRTISKVLGVSERTLRKRRMESDFLELDMEYSTLTEDELDDELRKIMELTPRSGESFMTGALRSRGIRIRGQDLRDSLNRIDPVSRALRRRRVTYRRKYSVPHANYIWHIDGNHKLIDPW